MLKKTERKLENLLFVLLIIVFVGVSSYTVFQTWKYNSQCPRLIPVRLVPQETPEPIDVFNDA